MAALKRVILAITLKATVALVANRFVTNAGAYPIAGGLAVGATDSDAEIDTNFTANASGIVPVEASGPIALTDKVASTVDGRAAVAVLGNHVLGIPLTTAAAAGDVIEILRDTSAVIL